MPTAKTPSELKEKIEVEKELLSAMPRNNEKNINSFNAKIDDLIKEYNDFKLKILDSMQKIYNKEVEYKSSNDIDNLQKRIDTIKDNLNILNTYENSFEKMELDRLLYAVSHYYKENFENVNNQILECINKFKSVEIELTDEDFNYSYYSKMYMKYFFEELKKNDINSDRIKSKFESIYWKCPELLMHIELNFRNLYYKNEAKINKFFEKVEIDTLAEWGKKSEDIIKTYKEIKKQKNQLMQEKKSFIIENFLNNKFKTSDFTIDKIKTYYKKVMTDELIEKKRTNEIEVEENINKFLDNLFEYKNYLKYKYIIDDIKNYYSDKDKYKKAYSERLKKIEKEEKKLSALYKKMNNKGFFGIKKVKIPDNLMEQNEIVKALKDMYKELEQDKMYDKINEKLNKSSTIYDAFRLGESSYNYLVKCIISNNPKITKEEIKSEITNIHEFIQGLNCTIINNIAFLEDRDISIVIKDMYKLLGFKIENNELDPVNLDNLIMTLEIIRCNYCMKKTKLTVQKIDEILKYKKILKI